MKKPIFDGRPLRGTTDAYGSRFVIETFESQEHPGFCHASVMCLDDDFVDETKRPVKIDCLEHTLKILLEPHNLKINEFEWEEVPKKELVLFHPELSEIEKIKHESLEYYTNDNNLIHGEIEEADIILQSMNPSRLCICLGENVEFYVDAVVVKAIVELMKKAKIENDDFENIVNSTKINVEYSKDEENEEDMWCSVMIGDFKISYLCEKEFNNLRKGFEEFIRWTEKFKISSVFLYRVR